MLTCGECGKKLKTKRIRTRSGDIEVDICSSCSKIFFDRGEVNRLSESESKKIVQDLPKPPRNPYEVSSVCPKCGNSLSRYWGEAVPNDVYVLRCPNCAGTWFSGDDLVDFKAAQESKINYYKQWKIPLPSLSSVIIPVLLLVSLTLITFISVSNLQKAQYRSSRAKEFISKPSVIPSDSPDTYILVFSTDTPSTTELEIKLVPSGKIISVPASLSPTTSHQVIIPSSGLGQAFQYKVKALTGEETYESEWYEWER
jgi:Zn-finger nucleic acid-binding protein